ncbi:hypothetical protein ACLOJK_032979 [Asimina triloba]
MEGRRTVGLERRRQSEERFRGSEKTGFEKRFWRCYVAGFYPPTTAKGQRNSQRCRDFDARRSGEVDTQDQRIIHAEPMYMQSNDHGQWTNRLRSTLQIQQSSDGKACRATCAMFRLRGEGA